MTLPDRGASPTSARLIQAVAALAAMLLGFVPAGAEAGTGRISTPRAGQVLNAGQLLSITWDGVPEGSEELEILLLPDGGNGYLRLTRMLTPQTRMYSWRVPNLPRIQARLQIRYGRGGVEHPCEPSSPFTIEPSLGRPVAAIALRAGEWWLGGHHGLTAMAVMLNGGEDGESIVARCMGWIAAVLPTGPECASNPTLPADRHEPGLLHSEQQPEERFGLPRRPMDVPLRP